MSSYRNAIHAATSVKVAGEIGAPLLTTADDAKAKWRQVRVDTDNLNRDVTAWYASGRATSPTQKNFVNAWVAWRDDTYKQCRDVENMGTIPFTNFRELAWSVFDRGDNKLTELKKWRVDYQTRSGMAATAPGSMAEIDKPTTPTPGWLYPALAIGGVVAVGGLITAWKK